MRIVIDLQGAQGANCQRGIGKYSLNLAAGLVRLRNSHEVYLVLNGALAESIRPIRAAFEGILPQERILVWSAAMPPASIGPANAEQRFQAELLREAFLASLEPDWVVVLSHFEGQNDNATTSIGAWCRLPTAVILYDLIPWIHADHYLAHATDRAWYFSKFDSLKRADLLLSISSSTRSDAIHNLGFDPQQVVNISAAVETHFTPRQPTSRDLFRLAEVYGLNRPFIMYTGGADYRKNIDRLIKSFALLPRSVRILHQLAIVCYVNDEWRERLLKTVDEAGLGRDEVILTGYVPGADLHLIYNACKLFVFPSWHEGFGLPVLEAMQCGKPVIAAKLTSLPEVVGREDALFDPFDLTSITATLERGLTDEEFRQSLEEHSLRHCRQFSWDETATRAWAAFEYGLQKRTATLSPTRRLRLAFVSPLPPERSGIADYSVSLLMELTRWYRIDVVVTNPEEMSDAYVRATCGILSVQAFRDGADNYDRVLYHFGNSEVHKHMFDLLSEIPGVVVLHDFYLSAIQMWSELHNIRFAAMARALFVEGGYKSVAEMFAPTKKRFDYDDYPASLPVIQDSLGVIVHSEYSCALAEKWYGKASRQKFSIIPFLNRVSAESSKGRAVARQRLGIAADSFIVCSFGFVTESKLAASLVNAWMASTLASRTDAHCVFVGEAPGVYGEQIKKVLKEKPQAQRIKITGWVDEVNYRLWLDAADVAVQLRKNSRGETSASIYDCMGKGLCTIVNAHGFAAELAPDAVWMLSDKFTDDDLVEALGTLSKDPARRQRIGDYARLLIQATQNSRLCAEMYFDVIEKAHMRADRDFLGIAKLVNKEGGVLSYDFVDALAKNNVLQPRPRMLLIDISSILAYEINGRIDLDRRLVLRELLLNPPSGFNVEPFFAVDGGSTYRYARQFTLRILGCPLAVAFDDVVGACNGDVVVSLDCRDSAVKVQEDFYAHLRMIGVSILFLSFNENTNTYPGLIMGSIDEALESLLRGGLYRSVAEALRDWFVDLDNLRVTKSTFAWFALGAPFGGANFVPAEEIKHSAFPISGGTTTKSRSNATRSVIVLNRSQSDVEFSPSGRNLFHILIQDGMKLPVSLPDIVTRNIESLKDVYPDYAHTTFSGESLRDFISQHYDNEVLNAFDTMEPYAYKADLGRYCLLHTLGGVYSDISNRFLRPIPLTDDHVIAAFCDTNGGLGAPWSVNNGIIAARKNSAEMGLMIKKVLESVRDRFYGRSPLSPTGPDMFGRVLAECYNPLQYLIGDMACITRTFSQNITFVFLEPSGALVAVRMKAQGGDSSELGINFNNNYNNLWGSRLVYGER